jgi:hypothetical protein
MRRALAGDDHTKIWRALFTSPCSSRPSALAEGRRVHFGDPPISSLPSWKLTMAPTVPTMRVRAGESEVFSMPQFLSRGQKP